MIFSKEWNDEAEWLDRKDAQRVAQQVGGIVVYRNKAYNVLLSWGSYVKKNLVLALVTNPPVFKDDPWQDYPQYKVIPNVQRVNT